MKRKIEDTELMTTLELMTVPEVAETCSISVETVRRLTDSGAMPKPVRLGRAVRYRRRELLEWIKNGCPKQTGRKR